MLEHEFRFLCDHPDEEIDEIRCDVCGEVVGVCCALCGEMFFEDFPGQEFVCACERNNAAG